MKKNLGLLLLIVGVLFCGCSDLSSVDTSVFVGEWEWSNDSSIPSYYQSFTYVFTEDTYVFTKVDGGSTYIESGSYSPDEELINYIHFTPISYTKDAVAQALPADYNMEYIIDSDNNKLSLSGLVLTKK